MEPHQSGEVIGRICWELVGGGDNILQQIMGLHYATTGERDLGYRLTILRRDLSEHKGSGEYTLKQIRETEEHLKRCQEILKAGKETASYICGKLTEGFRKLSVSDRSTLLRFLCDCQKFPIEIGPVYDQESLLQGKPASYNYKGGEYFGLNEWLRNSDCWRGLPFRKDDLAHNETCPFIVLSGTRDTANVLNKGVKDADLVKTLRIFDFFGQNIPATLVSVGIIGGCDESSTRKRYNAINSHRWSESTGGYYHYQTTREVDSLDILHIIDFDKLFNVEGITDYTIDLAGKRARKP